MDNILKLILLMLFSINANATWTQLNKDGPVQAQYMRTETYTQLTAKLAPIGNQGPALKTTSPNNSGGKYISPVTTDAATPKIASNVKIPVAVAAGATVAGTLTAVVTKSSMAKAGMALLRLNPYVSAAATLAWLANAGYQYFQSTDSFTEPMPLDTDIGWVSCLNPKLENGLTFFRQSNTSIYKTTAGNSQPCNAYSGGLLVCNTTALSGGYQSICRYPGQSRTSVPTTLAAVESKLANTPISGSVDTPQTINNQLGELLKNDYLPEITGTPQLRGPNGETQINQPGGTETTTEPDGSVAQRRLEYQTRFADDRAEIEQMLTETITPASGSPIITTTSKPADIDTATANSETKPDSQTDCDKYPTSVGCSQYGTVPAPESIPTTAVSMSLNPTSLGAGSCPSPQVLNLQGQPDITLSYQPYCNFATQVNPLVVAFAWLSAGLLVLGSIREA